MALTSNGVGTCGADDNQAQAGHLVVAPTLTASWGSNHGAPGRGTPIITAATAVRRLTPLECERLQGFPDEHTATSNGKVQADSARYRQMGNAVAVPCVEWIARRIVAVDGGAA